MKNKVVVPIMVIVLLIVAGIIFYQYWWAPKSKITPQEKACLESGGTISTAMCCKETSDFPNTCAVGACGCSPDGSHEVKSCNCGTDKCFDGTKCTVRATTKTEDKVIEKDGTANWKTYKSDKYNFELKYPTNWYYHVSDFSEVGRQMLCFNPKELSEDECIIPLVIDWDTSLEDMYNTAKETFKESSNITETTMSVGGVQAKIINIDAKTGITKTIFFEKGNIVYNFGMEVGYESYFDKIISTFKFTEQKSNGFIEGSLGYPSEFIPEDMVICAENIDTKKLYCTEEHLKDKKYTYGIGYRIEVPADDYFAYAYLPDNKDYKAYYSEFVTCGFEASCPSHEPIKVTVQINQTKSGIDPQDWYKF